MEFKFMLIKENTFFLVTGNTQAMESIIYFLETYRLCWSDPVSALKLLPIFLHNMYSYSI